MLSPDAGHTESVLRECAQIPVDPVDGELAAIAIAIHVEDALEVTVPPGLLDYAHLAAPAALAPTVRQLLGDR